MRRETEDNSLAAVYAALANDTRLRCLNLMVHNRDVCVCEAVAALGISQPAASKAMGALKSAGLADARRDANWTYYRLRSRLPVWLRQVVKATMTQFASQSPYLEDQRRFEALDLRDQTVSVEVGA